jgi:hypothetical protein
MAKPRDDRQRDLLRPALEAIIDLGHPPVRLALEAIIDLGHPPVRLAREIDWQFLDGRFAGVCAAGAGQPGLPTRLVAGVLILKHMHDLADEVSCARWLENPYDRFFCGELSFCHQLPFGLANAGTTILYASAKVSIPSAAARCSTATIWANRGPSRSADRAASRQTIATGSPL